MPWRFWRAAVMPPAALVRRSLAVEWPAIRASIDAGRFATVGLVRHHGWSPFELSRDHQVLAYGYAVDPGSVAVTLRVYDPNWPDRDDITRTLAGAGLAQSTGERLLGVIGLQPVTPSRQMAAP